MNDKRVSIVWLLVVIVAVLAGIAISLIILIARGSNGTSVSGFAVTPAQEQQWQQELEDTLPVAQDCTSQQQWQMKANLASDPKLHAYFQFKADFYGQLCATEGQ